MPKEDKTSSLSSIGIRILPSDVFIQEKYSVMLKEISCKNVMKNILSHNPIKEELNQEQEEICMLYSQQVNQQTDQEEILPLDCILNSKSQ